MADFAKNTCNGFNTGKQRIVPDCTTNVSSAVNMSTLPKMRTKLCIIVSSICVLLATIPAMSVIVSKLLGIDMPAFLSLGTLGWSGNTNIAKYTRRDLPCASSVLFHISPDMHELSNEVWTTQLRTNSRTAKKANLHDMHDLPDISDSSVLPVYTKAEVNSGETSGEAQAALNLAREMIDQGKMERAGKILQHAMALDPRHPDVLTEYGEFLERAKSDVVTAELMYCKALVLSPSHSRALSNHKRTLPLVEEIDQTRFNRIDRKREVLMRVPENHPGLRRMVTENYFRHIYHTTAIEGNTFTLSQTRSFVETHIVVAGKSIMEHNEILGMEAALSFLNTSLIKRIGAITVRDILDIHRRVLGYVDPVGAGIFRTTQVFVAKFVPPEPRFVENLVAEFVEWLNSDDALSLHPIEFAALAHYRLVYIHPFYDGNGRTSRLLMNLLLMQAGFPPIIIPIEDKQEYYEHLQTANDGDVRPFIRFIARCTERTVDEYLWSAIENPQRTIPGIEPLNTAPANRMQNVIERCNDVPSEQTARRDGREHSAVYERSKDVERDNTPSIKCET